MRAVPRIVLFLALLAVGFAPAAAGTKPLHKAIHHRHHRIKTDLKATSRFNACIRALHCGRVSTKQCGDGMQACRTRFPLK